MKLPNWLPLSYALSKHLLRNEVHKRYLNLAERKFFEEALVSYATWIAFIENNKKVPAIRDIPEEQQQQQTTNTTELDLAIFRVRSMIYEQLIPHLFKTDTKHICCSNQTISLEPLLKEAQGLTKPSVTDIDDAWKKFLEVNVKIKQEDQDSDAVSRVEDITEGQKRMTKDEYDGKEEQQQPSQQNDSTTAAKLEEANTITDDVPLIDVFHTLEFDKTAMIEQRKLEEFEAQQQLNEAEEEKENAAAKSLSMFNADGNFNLKYLLQGIVQNRQKTSLSDRELQNLLSDFRPHRSKWANDDRPGQEELYEACEKVLNDLKNFTEHSTPFLNKVSKREAPDYFDVIKKPMDLGTVTKKLKNFVYKSKKEFADDLYLIYDNCLTYNTTNGSEYRKHAAAMKRKTDRLLPRVPDITIKEVKSEVEEEVDDLTEDEEHETGRVSRKAAGKHMASKSMNRKAIPQSKQPAQQQQQHDRQPSRERSMTRGSSAAPSTTDADWDMNDAATPEKGTPLAQYGGKKPAKSTENNEDQNDLDQEEKKLNTDIDADLGEFQDQVWRDKTKKTRAKITTDVEKQYQFPFGEREILIRSALDMERFSMIQHLHNKPEAVMKLIRCEFERFSKWTDRRATNTTLYDSFDLDSSDDENLDAFFSRKIAKPNKTIDDSAKNDLFLFDYEIACGLPEIEGVPEDVIEPTVSNTQIGGATPLTMPSLVSKPMLRKSSVDLSPEAVLAAQGYSNVPLEVYQEVHFPTHGLTPLIDKNIETLQQIRTIYTKCSAIKNDTPISNLTASIDLEEPINSENELESHISTSLPITTTANFRTSKIPPLTLNAESCHQMMQKVLTKLLTHAGFEGAKAGALNVLTDIMIDYMTNIGKTLRTYCDNYGNKMDSDEILAHTLYENGILDVSDLESYVHDDIERNVQRLDDLHRRLQTSYQELLSGPTERIIDEEEMLNDDETFITGIFGEDIGEDYFGFKNLGLTQEYNMSSLTV
ncbi:hypothetical protein BDF20DRAFT_394859 [Mycotypha africana]|uniref:uncharacterized protein n=1 Tax=Mycotypha africana TaxID=64632 RepID=UPI00230105EA|nr:uncharacterized protein BDF20DRAFT_394859 [Mycotypha africana]KAI8984540.1 hypothetical protein BDF20DRAFT_394859 [Mycotypha africana]